MRPPRGPVRDLTGRLRARAFAAAALLIVCALGLWCALAVAGRVPEAYNFGDGALTELYTLHASRGIWGLGPYSRFTWHHPGPLYFYLLAPFYLASGQHALGMTAGASAIALLSLVTIAWALVRHAHAAAAATVLAGVALYLDRLPRLLTSVWNPHVLLLPYAALIIVGAVAASGRLAWLPLVALLASFIAQTHAGLAPSAAALAACAAAAGIWSSPSASRRWRWLALAGLTLVVVWFPAIYQQLTERPGNLSQLLAFFVSDAGPDPVIAFRDAFRIWVGTMLAPVRGGLVVPMGSAPPPMIDSLLAGALVTAEVVLLGLAGARAARRRLMVEAWLCWLSAVAAVAGLLALSRIRGGLADYITFWNTIAGLLAASALAAVAAVWIAERVRLRIDARAAAHLARLVPAAALAVIVIAAIFSARQLQSHREALMVRDVTPPVGRLYQATRGAIAKARLSRPRVELRGAWSDAAGILLQLHKRHVLFGIESDWTWMFGAPLVARGDESGTVIFARGEAGRTAAAEPGDCLIAWAHQTSVHLRAPTPEQYANLACLSYEEASR